MAQFRSLRLPAVLVAGAAASALSAAPALATEGPAAPPPPPSLPTGIAPATITPFPSMAAPPVTTRAPRVLRNARLVHRRVKRGRRGLLRVSLNTPSRLRIVMRRVANGRRIRVINVPARGKLVRLRLPARHRGHALRRGRYRISVAAIDANGVSSAPLKRTLTVRR